MSDQQKDPRNFGRRTESRPVSHTSGERTFGKPAGERKPGERNFGRPAGERKPGERSFGRPAGERKPGERTFGKPAGERKPGERSFGKPAGERKPGERTFGKPAGERKPGERTFGKPAGERKPGERSFGKPAGERKPGERTFGKPAGERKPGERSFVRPAAPRRQAPHGDGLAARRVAFRVLHEVAENGAYAALALDRELTRSGLSPADRRLASSLVYDTLENQLRLDWALKDFMRKDDTDMKLRVILRLGACQLLLYDKIPASAAVNTAVSLCKDAGMPGLAGVCNAILRGLDRDRESIVYPDPEGEPAQYLSVMYSLPLWLVERLMAAYGHDTAAAIAAYRQRDAGITLRPNLTTLNGSAFEKLLDRKVWQWEKGLAPDAYIIHGAADISHDADFQGGRFSIQSQSSMFAALAIETRPGMQLLDVCAAPGGKTCYLAERLNGTGRVQSWDLHPHRVKLIEAQAHRLHLDNVRPMARDATVFREELERTMDAVLLDAPCSGTGVMAGKPDVKYRVTAQDVEALTATQQALLETCCRYVKPGGQLVYSTCSILPEENALQLRRFLENHPEFTLLPLPDSFPAALRERYGAEGLQLLPHRDHLDGFFIARMGRKP